ncbi:MAG: hypothetical protein OEW67_14370 [Cyclobacteriaceae bacterium]|nr:hypothetical protein [Cyclobacteriaceae bacterium]
MKNKRIIIVLLATAILQSCTVYLSSSATLEGTVDKGKVKVITNYGSTFEFNKIVFIMGLKIKTSDAKDIYLSGVKESVKFFRERNYNL